MSLASNNRSLDLPLPYNLSHIVCLKLHSESSIFEGLLSQIFWLERNSGNCTVPILTLCQFSNIYCQSSVMVLIIFLLNNNYLFSTSIIIQLYLWGYRFFDYVRQLLTRMTYTKCASLCPYLFQKISKNFWIWVIKIQSMPVKLRLAPCPFIASTWDFESPLFYSEETHHPHFFSNFNLCMRPVGNLCFMASARTNWFM